MVKKPGIDVIVRPKRQITISKKICDQMGIEPGDVLELTVENSAIVARPRKNVALEALKEIQKTFQRSGVTREDLNKNSRRIRKEVARELYGGKA